MCILQGRTVPYCPVRREPSTTHLQSLHVRVLPGKYVVFVCIILCTLAACAWTWVYACVCVRVSLQCTFATCDDEEYLNRNVRPLINKYVRLTVTPEGVTLKETAPSGKRHAHHHAKAEGHDGRKAASARAGQAGSASEWPSMSHMYCLMHCVVALVTRRWLINMHVVRVHARFVATFASCDS